MKKISPFIFPSYAPVLKLQHFRDCP